ncbi:MAG: CHASE2 domain-containing protein, partial [Desulforhopalus sp.]
MSSRLHFLNGVGPFLITGFVAILVVVVFLNGNSLIDIIELKTYDLRLISRGRIEPSPTVMLAVVDEKSLQREGRWPWPRTKMADLINILSRDGARVISFDIGFFEPDSNNQIPFLDSFERNLDTLGIDSPVLAGFLANSKKNMDNDQVLAKAISDSSATVVLGYFFHMNAADLDYRVETEEIDEQISRISGSKYPLIIYKGDEKDAEFIHADMPEANLDILAGSTGAAGFFSVKNDKDGVVRWMPLVIECRKDLYPPLAVVSVYHYLGKPQLMVEVGKNGIDGIRMGKRYIPTDEMGQLLINYLGPPKTFPHISITDILSGRLPPGTFRDKIVVIGATMGTYDLRSTSITPLYPGLEIHGTVIDNILTGNFLVKPGWSLIFDLTAILVLAGLSGYAMPRLGALQGALFTVVLFYLYIFLAYWLLDHFRLWLNIVYPLLALLLNYTVLRLYSYITRDRERKKIQGTFKQYVAPLVIKEMIKDPGKLKLGGE